MKVVRLNSFDWSIEVLELEILKETEKTYKVKPTSFYNTVVKKSDIDRLNTKFGVYVYTFDEEKAKKMILEHCKNVVKSKKEAYLNSEIKLLNLNTQLH